jgi:hypothetical protein
MASVSSTLSAQPEAPQVVVLERATISATAVN